MMAIAAAPAATTALLFAGEPLYAQATRFVSGWGINPTLKNGIIDTLYWSGVGFGAGTLISSMTGARMLPAMAAGAAGGAILAAAYRTLEAAHNAAYEKFGFYRTITNTVKKIWNFLVPKVIRKVGSAIIDGGVTILTMSGSIARTHEQTSALRWVLQAPSTRIWNFSLFALGGVIRYSVNAILNPWSHSATARSALHAVSPAATIGTVALAALGLFADYGRRQGLTPVDVNLFGRVFEVGTYTQFRIVTALSVAAITWAAVMAVNLLVRTIASYAKRGQQEEFKDQVSELLNDFHAETNYEELRETLEALLTTDIEDTLIEDTLSRIDSNEHDLEVAVEEADEEAGSGEEVIAAFKASVTKDPAPTISSSKKKKGKKKPVDYKIKRQADIDEEHVRRINKQASTTTSRPLIPPILDLEIGNGQRDKTDRDFVAKFFQ